MMSTVAMMISTYSGFMSVMLDPARLSVASGSNCMSSVLTLSVRALSKEENSGDREPASFALLRDEECDEDLRGFVSTSAAKLTDGLCLRVPSGVERELPPEVFLESSRGLVGSDFGGMSTVKASENTSLRTSSP